MRVGVESEAELARNVVAELQLLGYDTYEEVSCGYGGKRADVVAVRGPVVMVVECKMSMSIRLLDQLCEWEGSAHYIIGAVPPSRRGRAVFQLLKAIGAGLWFVGQFDGIREDIAPRLHRQADTARLRRSLNPAQRSGTCLAAGSKGGGYWTPFLGTCRAIAETVAKEPGITLREALTKAGHHYSSTKSAVSSMPALIRKGIVAGVRIDDGTPPRLYPATSIDARLTDSELGKAIGSAEKASSSLLTGIPQEPPA